MYRLEVHFGRLLTSLMYFLDGIEGSMVWVRVYRGDFSHSVFHRALDFVFCNTISADALLCSHRPLRYFGSRCAGLLCASPFTASLASFSAKSLPATLICPGIHHIVRLKLPCASLRFSKCLVILSNWSATYPLPILFITSPVWIAAWLLISMEAG